ncbi:MAG: hypothetical protein ACLSAH_13210 [Bilophila wadsworthia]
MRRVPDRGADMVRSAWPRCSASAGRRCSPCSGGWPWSVHCVPLADGPLTSGGDVIAAWGPLEVSRGGAADPARDHQVNAIVMTFLALVATMDSRPSATR